VNSTNPYAPPRAEVRDFDSAPLILAGRGTRLVGSILDGLIFAAMVYLPAIVVYGVLGGFQTDSDATPEDVAIGFAILVGVVGLIACCLLNLLFVIRNSQSIAKKLLGIKVVRSDGSHASLARIFWLRNIVNGLLGAIPLYSLIDPLFIFGDQRQCVHDKLADTIVIQA
jgi:uncharacterized RDD family membrane protein YckC